MNISLTMKTQNVRSFNLSSQDGFFKNKTKAVTLEQDDIILLTNTQVGDKSHMLMKEFNIEGYTSNIEFIDSWTTGPTVKAKIHRIQY